MTFGRSDLLAKVFSVILIWLVISSAEVTLVGIFMVGGPLVYLSLLCAAGGLEAKGRCCDSGQLCWTSHFPCRHGHFGHGKGLCQTHRRYHLTLQVMAAFTGLTSSPYAACSVRAYHLSTICAASLDHL